ncbi:MAG TPA: dihydroorotate dehydrogenase electron transfer subunit [Ignavibacteriaceae bacterium]|nr:dihydroorotate dehydrogenase electron transfer subunit [Ignavibacteriaceae bacterium]
MFIVEAPILKIVELENSIILLKVSAPKIAHIIKPGQFVNVRVSETTFPLLRRPFSVCDVEGDCIVLMFNVLGEGTKILAHKCKGDPIDILGPLGNGFNLENDYDKAIIVAGGLGAAPFPFLLRELGEKKDVRCFIGGRTQKDVITYGLRNVKVSTDDGSFGFKGNIVELLNSHLDELKGNVQIFACGPNAMLRALKEFCVKNNIRCQVSTESAMACGFGICQGCPMPSAKDPDKYLLVCKDGPVFNIEDIII